MSDEIPDVPPWEPIADWLARMQNYEATWTETQQTIRENYEKEAKAIAYDIATYGVGNE